MKRGPCETHAINGPCPDCGLTNPGDSRRRAVWIDGVEYVPGDSVKCWRCGETTAEVERLRSALRVIRGPEDAGPWIAIYREAGGGYQGLQAIAEAALGESS